MLYQDLTALSDYAAMCTDLVSSVWWGMQKCVGRKISDTFLDKMMKISLIDKVTKYFGQLEGNYRVQCHDNYMYNWSEACNRIKDKYQNFLEWKEGDEDDGNE